MRITLLEYYYIFILVATLVVIHVSMSCDTVMTLQDRGDSKFKLEIII